MSYHRCDVPEHGNLESEREAVLSLLDDEEWHVGGAWGDYGEPVVLVRNVKERMGVQIGDAVPSSDYAANYAEALNAAVSAEQRVAELEAAIRKHRGRSEHGSTVEERELWAVLGDQ